MSRAFENRSLSAGFKKLVAHLVAIAPIKEYSDEIWRFYIPTSRSRKKWIYQSFVKYQNVIYWSITCEMQRMQLEFDLKKSRLTGDLQPVRPSLSELIQVTIKELVQIKKDWINYHRQLLRDLPKSCRFGLIQRRILRELWPDMYRPELEFSRQDYVRLMESLEIQERAPETHAVASVTLKTYLDYCRVAYLANLNKYKHSIRRTMSGLDMYKAMADGRHEGLIELEPDSAEAFQGWYDSKRGGGHPWEICRGGNTTHIDLGVCRENGRWYIFLDGMSSGRLVETARMALAFQKNGMPFRWLGAGDVKLKLQGRDNIGLIPEDESLHRAYQLFDRTHHVFDCAHLSDLGTAKAKVRPFICWLPLEPLCPKMS